MSKKSHSKAPKKKTGSTQLNTRRNNKSAKKQQVHSKKRNSNNKETTNPLAKNFNELRHEIFKFGLSGLEKKEQVDARVELAIKLGARPKKWIKPCQQLTSETRKTLPAGEQVTIAERVRKSQLE